VRQHVARLRLCVAIFLLCCPCVEASRCTLQAKNAKMRELLRQYLAGAQRAEQDLLSLGPVD
jgi:hypothetical protein